MEDRYDYLKNDVLDNLTVRVTNTLPYLKDLNPATIWETPVSLCKKIENNVGEVASVILETNKDSGHYRNNSMNPSNSQMLVTRIYILLYYCHKDDSLYDAVVFPVLQKHMGLYSERYLKDIHDKVSKFIEIDDIIKQNYQKKKKNIKPQFSLIDLTNGEADEYFREYSREALFSRLCPYLESLKEEYFPHFDVAAVWLTAKDVVQKLWQEQNPESFIDRIIHKLRDSADELGLERDCASAVILCAYAMMRTVNNNGHFRKAIEYIEVSPRNGIEIISGFRRINNDYGLLETEIIIMKRMIDDTLPIFDDYDYTGATINVQETFSKEDVEHMLQRQASQIEVLKEELEAEKNKVEKQKTQIQLVEEMKERVAQLEEEMRQQRNQKEIEEETIDIILDDNNKVTLNQKIVFFVAVLSVMLDKKYTHLGNLAEFISVICNEKKDTIRPMLSKISRMENDQRLQAILYQAAQAVSDMLKKIMTDSTKNDEGQNINKIRKNLELLFPLPEDN